MDGLTGGRRPQLFEKTLLFLHPHPVWWRALFFPRYSSFIGLSKRKLGNHSSSRKSVSRPPASLYSIQLPPLSLACLLCPLFPSWSLSSLVLAAFFFCSRPFLPPSSGLFATTEKYIELGCSTCLLFYFRHFHFKQCKQRKNERILSFQHVSCIFLVFLYSK